MKIGRLAASWNCSKRSEMAEALRAHTVGYSRFGESLEPSKATSHLMQSSHHIPQKVHRTDYLSGTGEHHRGARNLSICYPSILAWSPPFHHGNRKAPSHGAYTLISTQERSYWWQHTSPGHIWWRSHSCSLCRGWIAPAGQGLVSLWRNVSLSSRTCASASQAATDASLVGRQSRWSHQRTVCCTWSHPVLKLET